MPVEPRHNRLLAALPAAVLQRWRPHLEPVDLPAGARLCRWGKDQTHVFFPTTASVSMLHTTREGVSVETVCVGNEGMVGIQIIMGGGSTLGDAIVQGGGHAVRLASVWLQDEFHGNPAVMDLLLRYAQAVMADTAQSVVCNQLHSVENRLCRCLLGSMDRARGAPMILTHQTLACMLGVRRESVTGAARNLQRAGVIDYTRGRLAVLDRKRLEAHSCECYRVVRKEYDRLLPFSPAAMYQPASRPPLPRESRELSAPFAVGACRPGAYAERQAVPA